MKKLLETDKMSRLLKCIPFVLAFFLMTHLLYDAETMCDTSGDANENWLVILSYGKEKLYGSYVLYKGLIILYPWVWLRKASIIIGLNEWTLIKLFYILCFSYVSAIGFPKIIEKLTGDENKWWRNAILVICCYYFWSTGYVLTQLVIDLPCLTFFVFFVNLALDYNNGREGILFCSLLGILLGINLTASGQYTLPSVLIIIFLLIAFFDKIKVEKNRKKHSLYLVIISLFASLIKYSNVYFLKHVVGGLREEGAWIPTAGQWLSVGLTRFDKTLRQFQGIRIVSNRGGALLEELVGSEYYASNLDSIIGGAYPITVLEYFKWFLKYPLDFISLFVDRFILGMTMGYGELRFVPIFISYTIFFLSLLLIFNKCKMMKDIFNRKTWIVLAFVGAIVSCVASAVEVRVWIQIQGLVMAAAICSNCFWEGMKNIVKTNTYGKGFSERKINYSVVVYIVFMLMAMSHIAGLYAGSVEGTEVLWKFF